MRTEKEISQQKEKPTRWWLRCVTEKTHLQKGSIHKGKDKERGVGGRESERVGGVREK